MNLNFRQASVDEVDAAHVIYLDVVDWLRAKAIRQWLRPLTLEEFAARQARDELFAGFLDSRMAAHATVAFEGDEDWRAQLGSEQHWWIKTLTVARAYEGRGLGKLMLERSEVFVRKSGGNELCLECVDYGFLPDYYAKLGYEALHRANITYPSGNTFPVALMRKSLG